MPKTDVLFERGQYPSQVSPWVTSRCCPDQKRDKIYLIFCLKFGFHFNRTTFSLGFIPLSKLERDQFGFVNLWNWRSSGFQLMREKMYEAYQGQLEETLKMVGKLHFSNYMRKAINLNPKLDSGQKELLQAFLTGIDPEEGERTEQESAFIQKMQALTAEQMEQRFYHLFFYMLGIETYNNIDDDWISVDLPPEPGISLIEEEEDEEEGVDLEEDWVKVSGDLE